MLHFYSSQLYIVEFFLIGNRMFQLIVMHMIAIYCKDKEKFNSIFHFFTTSERINVFLGMSF